MDMSTTSSAYFLLILTLNHDPMKTQQITIPLSRLDQENLAETLINSPPPPNNKLIDAALLYSELVIASQNDENGP
jgi:hypothetical protein